MKKTAEEKFAIAAVALWGLYVLVSLAIPVTLIYIFLHFVAKYW